MGTDSRGVIPFSLRLGQTASPQVWGCFYSLSHSGYCSLGSWVCVGTSVGLSTLGWSLCVLMPGFGSSRGQALDGTGCQATGQLGIPPVPRAFAVSIFGPCHFLTVATVMLLKTGFHVLSCHLDVTVRSVVRWVSWALPRETAVCVACCLRLSGGLRCFFYC